MKSHQSHNATLVVCMSNKNNLDLNSYRSNIGQE